MICTIPVMPVLRYPLLPAMLRADLSQEEGEVIAVVGDGAMTGGIAFEALNNVGNSGSKMIVILNDNEMSIEKNGVAYRSISVS